MKVAIINHKGGVGKTTLAVNIAFRYKERKQRLFLVDFDKQHNSLQLFSGYTWKGDDVWYDDTKLITLTKGIFEGIQNCMDDVVFDCPPSFESSNSFISYLGSVGINIDVWLIPVESRTSIMGANTITNTIRSVYPTSRIIFVMNRCNTNSLTQKDRIELVQFPNVELYNQVIQQSPCGLTMFEQKGGKSVWEYYKGKQFAVRMRDFCDWILLGCKGKTFKNDANALIDANRETFINTPSNRRREYGER